MHNALSFVTGVLLQGNTGDVLNGAVVLGKTGTCYDFQMDDLSGLK
jgi:hypothetical protein